MLHQNVECLVVDTTAFIQNALLQDIGKKMITCKEVVDEITNKRQLRRLVVLPYDLEIREVFPENVQFITEFSKKTGDYPSLSATDIKVMALTYQIEKEKSGIDHLKKCPAIQRSVTISTKEEPLKNVDIVGFHLPGKKKADQSQSVDSALNSEIKEDRNNAINETLRQNFQSLTCEESEELENIDNDVLQSVIPYDENCVSDEYEEDSDGNDSDWITPSNIQKIKKQMNGELMEEKVVNVACITTDFAMQNVLKQINLNVAALDGRIIKQLRTFILRCYSCFNTTSIMTKLFCPKCGNKTLKRVAVSLDENGKLQIHINSRRPLTVRGKKFSLPKMKGGKHSNNPILVEDQPMPDQRPSRLARTKNNPLDDDYIAGYSPFVMRDVNSKSAQLKIRPTSTIKYWMQKNPNENARLRRK